MVATGGRDIEGAGAASRRARMPAAQRRETILRAAAEVFAQAGYRAARVSDVAARVGVTEPVIFQNFGTKVALFTAVLERAAAEVQASLAQATAGFGSAHGLLGHILVAAADGRHAETTTGVGLSGDPTPDSHAGYGVLFADAIALATDPELSELARPCYLAVAGHLADVIRHAQENGDVRPDTDPEAAAWLLLSLLSAQRLRAEAMPADLEPAVTALALQILAPPSDQRDGNLSD